MQKLSPIYKNDMFVNPNIFKYYTFYALILHALFLTDLLPYSTWGIALFVAYVGFLINVMLHHCYDFIMDILVHYVPVMMLLCVKGPNLPVDADFLLWTLLVYIAVHGGVSNIWSYYADIQRHLCGGEKRRTLWERCRASTMEQLRLSQMTR